MMSKTTAFNFNIRSNNMMTYLAGHWDDLNL